VTQSYKAAVDLIKLKEFKSVEVQTVIDNNNLKFIDQADKYFEANSGIKEQKVFKIMRKVTFKLSAEKPMPLTHVVELI